MHFLNSAQLERARSPPLGDIVEICMRDWAHEARVAVGCSKRPQVNGARRSDRLSHKIFESRTKP